MLVERTQTRFTMACLLQHILKTKKLTDPSILADEWRWHRTNQSVTTSVDIPYIVHVICDNTPNSGILLCPHSGGIKRWCCLTSVWYLSRTSGRRVACAAGRLDGAYWLIGPGSAGLAQGCRCGLPLQAWAGAYRGGRPPARLQLVTNDMDDESVQFCTDTISSRYLVNLPLQKRII